MKNNTNSAEAQTELEPNVQALAPLVTGNVERESDSESKNDTDGTGLPAVAQQRSCSAEEEWSFGISDDRKGSKISICILNNKEFGYGVSAPISLERLKLLRNAFDKVISHAHTN